MGKFYSLNIGRRADGHLKHSTAFGGVGEVRIRLIQSPFEHEANIACSEKKKP